MSNRAHDLPIYLTLRSVTAAYVLQWLLVSYLLWTRLLLSYLEVGLGSTTRMLVAWQDFWIYHVGCFCQPPTCWSQVSMLLYNCCMLFVLKVSVVCYYLVACSASLILLKERWEREEEEEEENNKRTNFGSPWTSNRALVSVLCQDNFKPPKCLKRRVSEASKSVSTEPY